MVLPTAETFKPFLSKMTMVENMEYSITDLTCAIFNALTKRQGCEPLLDEVVAHFTLRHAVYDQPFVKQQLEALCQALVNQLEGVQAWDAFGVLDYYFEGFNGPLLLLREFPY